MSKGLGFYKFNSRRKICFIRQSPEHFVKVGQAVLAVQKWAAAGRAQLKVSSRLATVRGVHQRRLVIHQGTTCRQEMQQRICTQCLVMFLQHHGVL